MATIATLLTWASPAWSANAQITLALNGQTFAPGSSLTIMLSINSPGTQARGDLYLAALTPARSLVFLGQGLRLSGSPIPFDAGRGLVPGSETLGRVPLSRAVPAGSYQIFALIVRPGSSPLEPANHVSNLATAQFTFGAALSQASATGLANQAVDSPSLVLRTVDTNVRAILRTLAALRRGPGRSQASACPRTTERDVSPTPDRQGVTFTAFVDYGTGCRDNADGVFRRGAYLSLFEITRFDRRTLDPVAGTATLIFDNFFEGESSLSGLITDTFGPNQDEITGAITETSPRETLDQVFNLTSRFDPVHEIEFVNGAEFLESSVSGERAALFENVGFDQLTEVDPFTCDDPITGRMTVGDASDVAVFRFDISRHACGFAFLSLNGGPEQLVRLKGETSSLRSSMRAEGGASSLSGLRIQGRNAARRKTSR